jgi:hypothetical protein
MKDTEREAPEQEMSAAELEAEATAELPDREAMTLLGADLVSPFFPNPLPGLDTELPGPLDSEMSVGGAAKVPPDIAVPEPQTTPGGDFVVPPDVHAPDPEVA